MTYQTTAGWSLLSSGIVTFVLIVLSGDSLWWGIGLLLLGLATPLRGAAEGLQPVRRHVRTGPVYGVACTGKG